MSPRCCFVLTAALAAACGSPPPEMPPPLALRELYAAIGPGVRSRAPTPDR